jgi:hypothetical protein
MAGEEPKSCTLDYVSSRKEVQVSPLSVTAHFATPKGMGSYGCRAYSYKMAGIKESSRSVRDGDWG